MNNINTFVIGASSGSAESLAKLVRRIFSDAIDLASNPSDVYEPIKHIYLFVEHMCVYVMIFSIQIITNLPRLMLP